MNSSITCAAGATHIGQRALNEDSLLIDPTLGLYLVADGVGGHQAGDFASSLVCKSIQREILAGASLESAVLSANIAVLTEAKADPKRSNMASTVVASRFHAQQLEIAWAGDSRAYLWNGNLELLTRDHSAVQKLVDAGQISFQQAREHPQKNVIYQALGMREGQSLELNVIAGGLRVGEILLLCSDGLHDMLDDHCLSVELHQLAQRLQASDFDSLTAILQEKIDQLVAQAAAAGGQDNITGLLIAVAADCVENDQAPELASPPSVWRYDYLSKSYSGMDMPNKGLLLNAGDPISPRTDTKQNSSTVANTGADSTIKAQSQILRVLIIAGSLGTCVALYLICAAPW